MMDGSFRGPLESTDPGGELLNLMEYQIVYTTSEVNHDTPLTPSSTMVDCSTKERTHTIHFWYDLSIESEQHELSAMPTITTTTMAAASSTVTTTADLQVFDPLTNTHTTVPATEGKEGETEEQQD